VHALLADLDRIDWSRLSHAYGAADDVPDLLRTLAEANPDTIADAWWDMYSALFHQGSVYSATAAAVPFLVGLAGREDRRGDRELWLFLARIGFTRLRLSRPAEVHEGEEADRHAREREVIAAVSRAVTEGAATYALVASSADPATRLLGIAALAACDRLSGPLPFGAAYRDFMAAGDHEGAALVLLASAFAPLPPDPGLLDAALAGPEIVALAGALAAIRSDLPASMVREALTRLLATPSPWLALVHARDVRLECAVPGPDECLAWLDPAHRLALRAPLGEILRALDDDRAALDLACMLLEAAFPAPLPEGTAPSETMTDAQREVLEAILDSDAAWHLNGSLMHALGERTGQSAIDRDEWRKVLGIPEKVAVAIVTPRRLAAAAEQCSLLGKEAWLDAPWIFFRGDTSALEEEIPEDPDDFPPEVMRAAQRISMRLSHGLVAKVFPDLRGWRFYPQLDASALSAICARRGWPTIAIPDDLAPDEAALAAVAQAEQEGYDDEGDEDEGASEAQDPGVRWEELGEAQKALVTAFAQKADAAGWTEARRWLEFLKSSGPMRVSPPGVARHFGKKTDLELALCLYDEFIAAQTEQQVGDPYLRLTLASKDRESRLTFRIYFGARFTEALAVIFAHQDRVDVTNFGENLVPALLAVVPEGLGLDVGGGQLLRVGRKDEVEA
jgi:hypothetical protein